MDRDLLAAVPDTAPRQWFRHVMEQAAPHSIEAQAWVGAVTSKVEALDDAALTAIRDALDGKLGFGSLDGETLDVYFDLAALFAGSE